MLKSDACTVRTQESLSAKDKELARLQQCVTELKTQQAELKAVLTNQQVCLRARQGAAALWHVLYCATFTRLVRKEVCVRACVCVCV